MHTELPSESVYGEELKEMKSLDFLGAELEHETAKKIALGMMDPVTKEEFIVSESDVRIMEKICGKRSIAKPQAPQKGKKGKQTPKK